VKIKSKPGSEQIYYAINSNRKNMSFRTLAVNYVNTSIVFKRGVKKSKQYQRTSTNIMNNNAEYTRRYVHGVADGDAFSHSNRSLAQA
jgi:hypothetical protein